MAVSFITFLAKVSARLRDIVIHLAFWLFERVLPAREDFWCFCTWEKYPHTLDNPRAIFEEIKDNKRIRKIVLQKTPGKVVNDGNNVTFCSAESLAGAYFLARSRVLLTGYAVGGMSSYSDRIRATRHLVIQLWHGIPLKRIGHLFPGETFWTKETPRYAATVCSSTSDREMMARAFAPLPWDRVWQTGLPRNDLILSNEESLPADYQEQLNAIRAELNGRRLILYAPTWRVDVNSLYAFSPGELEQLERVLRRNNAVLGVRGHPNVRHSSLYKKGSGLDSILDMNGYAETNLILRETDILVTDYSSIYIDYLLLDRPIIHFVYDIDSYLKERGLLYSLEEALGGEIAKTFDNLVTELDCAAENPSRANDQRNEASKLFHQHGAPVSPEVVNRLEALIKATRLGNR